MEMGNIVMKRWKKSAPVVAQKDERDIATKADYESEQWCIQEIQKYYPDDECHGEETGVHSGSSGYMWYIDPLCGTKFFSAGLVNFYCSVAVEKGGELIASAVCQPIIPIAYSAGKDNGAWADNKRIKLKQASVLKDAIICAGLPSTKRQKSSAKKSWQLLAEVDERVYRIRSEASISGALCQTAFGSYDAYLLLGSSTPLWHDLAPGICFAQEAGMTVTNAAGLPIKKGVSPSLVVAQPSLHKELLALIKELS